MRPAQSEGVCGMLLPKGLPSRLCENVILPTSPERPAGRCHCRVLLRTHVDCSAIDPSLKPFSE